MNLVAPWLFRFLNRQWRYKITHFFDYAVMCGVIFVTHSGDRLPVSEEKWRLNTASKMIVLLINCIISKLKLGLIAYFLVAVFFVAVFLVVAFLAAGFLVAGFFSARSF